jgi:queuosine precursor transporter
MTNNKKAQAQRIYLYLTVIFITCLVVSNLIFQKFFFWYPFNLSIKNIKIFELSVGILPYPVTFLITDIISEIYGRKKANEVVTVGIVASFFSISIIYLANLVPATNWSPVDNNLFSKVFGSTPIAVFSSMTAYLFSQYIDIRIYHFWKNFTKGKYLWLRNNLSTFFSQFLDTFSILTLLCYFNKIEWELFFPLLAAGVIFKVFIAFLDTPFLYLGVYILRRKFNLELNQELKIN